jgi:hypothetical protein
MSTFGSDIAPPPHLEDRVVAVLQRKRLLARPRSAGIRIVGAAAAALLLFAGGYLAGGSRGLQPAADPTPGPRFALLLYEAGDAPLAPGTERARVDEYRAWARQVFRDGYAISGEKLKDEPGQPLSGFFIVSAPSRTAAQAIAASCPHTRYGGRIEIREIDPT